MTYVYYLEDTTGRPLVMRCFDHQCTPQHLTICFKVVIISGLRVGIVLIQESPNNTGVFLQGCTRCEDACVLGESRTLEQNKAA